MLIAVFVLIKMQEEYVNALFFEQPRDLLMRNWLTELTFPNFFTWNSNNFNISVLRDVPY